MSHARVTRVLVAAASATALLAMAACSSTATPSTSTAAGDCAAYTQYGDLTGKTVSLFTSIASDSEAKPHIDSYKPFEKCTGATIKYEGSRDFEAQLPVRVKAGNAPDLAYIPQPGLLATLVTENPGKVFPAGDLASKNVDTYYQAAWKGYGSVDGKFYAVPVGANVKSFVWYSPKAFSDKGYTVPATWDELMALSDKIVADNPNSDVKPWCAGIESGGATGWPATDWIEDLMLRVNGADVYDQWVNHTVPFNDPKVVAAIDKAGTILKDPKYVNGGFGGVKTIATTPFAEAGAPILDGNCFMHRQASFYQANWATFDKKATVGPDGDIWAFYLPSMTADSKPVLGGGEFAAAFSDRPEVQAFQAYLASPEWSNAKADATPNGGWLSANNKLDVNKLTMPVDKLSYQILSDEKAVFRFDGSDLMPSKVGAGSFWKEMTNWIALDKSSQDVADAIEKSWPAK
ncbi:MAG: ABC transporter substrate-binding protein [Actinobacteria bacterium]|nr:carbohydrate ABC transporter substrate-binding protein [Propionicimonas sp.]MBU3977143.1 ABC transporter substrate-binding protein [Actinomycetota bacterium]MBU3985083.1 ABC transporter substrate-binding protein [Actinomycetota bacterium]MBU4006960.1 ABC transporter substrate-binding protein [Actinomycetota bacterium]MBU4064713.1 ABC transporter substrate-binding protein [Actinomycetota bacterium]